MKIIWVGDAAVSSGFARCTHAACDALHKAGHTVHVMGMNYHGQDHNYSYAIHRCYCYNPSVKYRDIYGASRLPRLIERIRPDLVILLNDPWNIKGYLEFIRDSGICNVPPIVAWLAVDACNQPGHELNALRHVVTWTKFAAQELRIGGYTGSLSIIPLGVDRDVFYPRDKLEGRKAFYPDGLEDAFVVGVVGRNQPRKRLDLTIESFAYWVKTYDVPDNVHLFLHVAPTGDRGCCIGSLVRYYGLSGRVLVSTPSVDAGMPTDQLSLLYSSFDVYLTTTQGEGWGLPTLEAMSCGVPAIVPNFGALGEWTDEAAMRVPCCVKGLNAPINSKAYTIGETPLADDVAYCLESMRQEDLRDTASLRGRQLADKYSWDAVGESFVEGVLEWTK